MTLHPHRVQGLNQDSVAADWPAISVAEARWLQSRHPQLGGDWQLLWHSPRPLSAAAIVQTAHGKAFIKRHHQSVRTAATLGEEHGFIAHLAANGLPVVQVHADRDGQTALTHGDWTFEVHSVGHGEDLYRDAHSWTLATDVDDARQAGRMLARLHEAAAGYGGAQRGTHVLVARDDLLRADAPLQALAGQLAQRPGLAGYLAGTPWQDELQHSVLPWHTRLGTRLQDEPRLWCHNDWHVSNLLWQGQPSTPAVTTVLDFGLASPTSAVYDLATAIERNAIAWLALEHNPDAVRVDIALALIEGYRSVRPLSAKRLHLLADLLPVVHLDFALSEVEYFHAVTGSKANADVAYRTFLLGHAAWFNGAAGADLLQALHAAA